MVQPYKGANAAHFYIPEVTQGVTPANPAWYPLRNTGGIPAITRDTIISNELNGSREVTSIRTGSNQTSGEFAIELSAESQDELLAGAMSSSWQDGVSGSAVDVAVDATAKTFTRSAGSFLTDGVEVGDLIAFTDLAGNNSKPFLVTSVTETVVTGAGIQHELTTAAAAETDYKTGDKLETGNLCKSYSILTVLTGNCGTVDAYLLTKGVEFSGFTIEQAVNADVTGSLPFIGRTQEILTALPAGSTFPYSFEAEPFSSVDVSAYNGSAPLELIDTFTITNDNSASAQFALGNKNVAFIERGKAANTFSLAGKLFDMSLLQMFVDEEDIEVSSVLSGVTGAMSFTLKRATLTSATPEIGGAESITISLEGQATGNKTLSSIIIQRISYA